jgi:succinoglycan biosynthesis transport protein ExoP
LDDETPGRDVGGQVRDLTRVLREQWWIILLCVVVATFAAAVYTSTRDKQYDASARLLLQSDNLSSTIAGTQIGGLDPTRQAATDAQLVTSPEVSIRVQKRLKGSLAGTAVHASADPDSNVLTITARAKKPARAAAVANAYARQYIVFRRDSSRKRFQRALRTVESRLAQTRRGTPNYVALQGQAKQLKLLVSLQTGDADLVTPAGPPASAAEPKPARNLALGAIVGLVIGLLLAFLRDRLDRRLKNEDQLAELMPAVPIVGLVPEPRRGAVARMMTAEGYHTLRANLKILAHGREPKTLLVTSAAPGEGKSTVALNLALAMLEKGEKALVLDADLRRPSLSDRLMADRRVGVSSILAGNGTIDASIQARPVEPSRNGAGPTPALAGELALVPAGPQATNVPLLVNDRSLGALLEETRQRTEAIVFDGPPIGSFADMLPLAKDVDAVLLVVRLYHSRTDQLRRLVRQLENADITPVGVVVLGAGPSRAGYYSDYVQH